jgi:hypothetical protein
MNRSPTLDDDDFDIDNNDHDAVNRESSRAQGSHCEECDDYFADFSLFLKHRAKGHNKHFKFCAYCQDYVSTRSKTHNSTLKHTKNVQEARKRRRVDDANTNNRSKNNIDDDGVGDNAVVEFTAPGNGDDIKQHVANFFATCPTPTISPPAFDESKVHKMTGTLMVPLTTLEQQSHDNEKTLQFLGLFSEHKATREFSNAMFKMLNALDADIAPSLELATKVAQSRVAVVPVLQMDDLFYRNPLDVIVEALRGLQRVSK